MTPVDVKLHVSREKWIQNLYVFLTTEIDLGITFSRLAKHYLERGEAERFQTSKQNAVMALEAIDHFRHRLPADLKTEIDCGRQQLAAGISELSSGT